MRTICQQLENEVVVKLALKIPICLDAKKGTLDRQKDGKMLPPNVCNIKEIIRLLR